MCVLRGEGRGVLGVDLILLGADGMLSSSLREGTGGERGSGGEDSCGSVT